MRGERVIDAGSRFARSIDPAGVLAGSSRADPPATSSLAPSSDGSGASATGRSRLVILALALALGAMATLLLASSAGAATIHVPDTSFNMKTLFAAGQSESRGGAVAVDEETGYVYVMARSGSFQGDIERLDAAGNPVNFPGSPGRDETQQIQFEGFNNGDKFTLTCPNGETTAEIVWNEVGETFQSNSEAALNAKCGAGISISASPYFPRSPMKEPSPKPTFRRRPAREPREPASANFGARSTAPTNSM